MIDLDSISLEEPKTKESTRGVRDGGLTFVYHKNGKRIVFSKRLLNMIGNPATVSLRFTDGYLIITGGDDETFTLKEMSHQRVLYNAPLMMEIFEYYNIQLDGSCFTFSELEATTDENTVAVKINA